MEPAGSAHHCPGHENPSERSLDTPCFISWTLYEDRQRRDTKKSRLLSRDDFRSAATRNPNQTPWKRQDIQTYDGRNDVSVP